MLAGLLDGIKLTDWVTAVGTLFAFFLTVITYQYLKATQGILTQATTQSKIQSRQFEIAYRPYLSMASENVKIQTTAHDKSEDGAPTAIKGMIRVTFAVRNDSAVALKFQVTAQEFGQQIGGPRPAVLLLQPHNAMNIYTDYFKIPTIPVGQPIAGNWRIRIDYWPLQQPKDQPAAAQPVKRYFVERLFQFDASPPPEHWFPNFVNENGD
jgi:hypothetical protein